MQYLTKGKATDDQDQPATTMKHFADWFRSNDKIKKEPWIGDLSDMGPAGEKKDEKPEERKPEEKKEGNGPG
jgi:hypothetical protein